MPENKKFVEELVKQAKQYGWSGDYIEVEFFVRHVIEQNGLDPDDYDLTPDDN